mmetsp:Transcript_30466/g.71190  ORF Transcript_30466/g.71190 Transcript_30466/m.71190 type:complete len:223 (+) Transcript_30466:866-1534(+)
MAWSCSCIFLFFSLISASLLASASRTCPATLSFSFCRKDCRWATWRSIMRWRIACLCAAISASRSARSRILRSFSSAKNMMRFSSSSLACCSAILFSSCSLLLSFRVLAARAFSSSFALASCSFSSRMCASTLAMISSPSLFSARFCVTYRTLNSSSWSSCTCFPCRARCSASSFFRSSSSPPLRMASIVRSCHSRSSSFSRALMEFCTTICISLSLMTSDR